MTLKKCNRFTFVAASVSALLIRCPFLRNLLHKICVFDQPLLNQELRQSILFLTGGDMHRIVNPVRRYKLSKSQMNFAAVSDVPICLYYLESSIAASPFWRIYRKPQLGNRSTHSYSL